MITRNLIMNVSLMAVFSVPANISLANNTNETQGECVECAESNSFAVLKAAKKNLDEVFNRVKCKVLEVGEASYYGRKFDGKPTSSGEIFNHKKLTAAHPTLEFGEKVWVRFLETGREVQVRITDRGPHVSGRIIDLSTQAAKVIGLTGVGQVEIRRCKEGS